MEREARRRYDEKKEEPNKPIGLGIGFEGLGERLSEWEEDNERKARRMAKVGK